MTTPQPSVMKNPNKVLHRQYLEMNVASVEEVQSAALASASRSLLQSHTIKKMLLSESLGHGAPFCIPSY